MNFNNTIKLFIRSNLQLCIRWVTDEDMQLLKDSLVSYTRQSFVGKKVHRTTRLWEEKLQIGANQIGQWTQKQRALQVKFTDSTTSLRS